MRSFARLVFWLASGFAFVMAVVPHPPEFPQMHLWDKAQHFGAFAVLAVLALIAYPRVRPLYLALGLSLFGALIELVQSLPIVQRDSDVLDWIADSLALLIVVGSLSLLSRRRRSKSDAPSSL
jgi:VanZ family protein